VASHTAKSLFDMNMKSADECLRLYDGINALGTNLQIAWLLRGIIVFSISAMDAYFHDKIRYRAGKYGKLENLPAGLAKFPIPIGDLKSFTDATRRGNVIRNWIVESYSRRPLQTMQDIADALKIVGITDLWPSVEPNTKKREELLGRLSDFGKRRNAIAHEGDRKQFRSSGKKLSAMSREYAVDCMSFVRDLVDRVERKFPK
jgi:hypothetical protein